MDVSCDEACLRQALLQPSLDVDTTIEDGNYVGDIETPHDTPTASPPASSRFSGDEHESTSYGWLQQYSRILQRYPLVILCTLVLLWPFGVFSHLHLQSITESTFRPIHGTPSGVAEDRLMDLYSDNFFLDPMNPALYIILEGEDVTKPNTTAYESARSFSESLLNHLNETCWTWPGSKACDQNWLALTSFYSLYDQELHYLAKTTVIPNGTILQLQYSLPASKSKFHKRRVIQLMDAIDEYRVASQPTYFTVSYTGLRYFASDLSLSTRHDLIRMDLLVLPVALLLMGLVLPNANFLVLWVLPVVTMISSVCIWSITIDVVGRFLHISTFTPTIMMSLTLGMGIDYSLFLMSRYLEERKENDRETSILNMLQHSGRVLILSGLTLATTFAGLTVLPLGMLKSIGIGAAIAILSSLVVNLTLVPVLLYTEIGEWVVRNRTEIEGDPRTRSDGFAGFPRDSIFFRMSKHLLHKYRSIIILLLTIQALSLVAQDAFSVKSSISFDLLLPSDAPSLQVYNKVSASLGVGSLNPYRIIFDSISANFTMHSQHGFDVMHLVIGELRGIDSTEINEATHLAIESHDEIAILSERILQEIHADEDCRGTEFLAKKTPSTMFNGISVLKNNRLPHSVFVGAKYCAQLEPYCPFELFHTIDVIDQQLTSSDETATIVTASLGVNPFSDEGIQWLIQARDTIDRLETAGALNGVHVYIDGSAGIAHDAVNAVYQSFPAMIGTTSLIVIVLMGIFFKSIFPPIRSLISISFTLAFSFGLSVLVFEKGVFNWTNTRLLTSIGDEMCWLVPVMGFSIIVGLALDYDVFLVSRILEFRLEGYEHKASVALGLDSTGGIITAAGVIMVAAFGSLMFSANPVLYQWSFLLTTAVLLDTFVIRTIVVPILTGLAGKRCWWPRQLPEERRFFREFDEQERLDTSISSLLRALESTSEYEALRPH